MLVSTINIYEVFKKVLQQKDENAALQAIALMQQGRIIDRNTTLALSSAKLSHELNLPVADSIILATARSLKAILWTQDLHFANFPDVKYISLGGIEVIQNSVAKILQKGNSRIKI